jgi:Silencing defective 2 N-terminal ubiquitin domain
MASRKKRGPQDKSAMRDLSGRRIKAVQQAKELAEYIAKAPGLERKAREEKRRKLEAVLATNPAAGVKMDDHAYWEDKERLVEGVKSAVREAVRGARKNGDRVEVVHTVSVRGGGVKRDLKFAGFEEEYDDSSEDDRDQERDPVGLDQEEDRDDDETTGEEEDGDGEYEDSTEEEDPATV